LGTGHHFQPKNKKELLESVKEALGFENVNDIILKCDEVMFSSIGDDEIVSVAIERLDKTFDKKKNSQSTKTYTIIAENKNDVKVSLGSSALNQLVMSQKALGFWSLEKLDLLLNAMNIDKEEFTNLVTKCKDATYEKMEELKKQDKLGSKSSLEEEEVLTLLVLASLKKNFLKEHGKWKLIEKKAMKWLVQKNIDYVEEIVKSFALVIC